MPCLDWHHCVVRDGAQHAICNLGRHRKIASRRRIWCGISAHKYMCWRSVGILLITCKQHDIEDLLISSWVLFNYLSQRHLTKRSPQVTTSNVCQTIARSTSPRNTLESSVCIMKIAHLRVAKFVQFYTHTSISTPRIQRQHIYTCLVCAARLRFMLLFYALAPSHNSRARKDRAINDNKWYLRKVNQVKSRVHDASWRGAIGSHTYIYTFCRIYLCALCGSAMWVA